MKIRPGFFWELISSKEMSLDENLIQFYLSNRPGTFPEDALDIVKGLHSGINLYNMNLQKALQDEGFNYSAEIENIVSELPLNQKYDIYLNFLSAISTLNIKNMREDQLSEIENFQSIKGKLQSKGEINEDDVERTEHEEKSEDKEKESNNKEDYNDLLRDREEEKDDEENGDDASNVDGDKNKSDTGISW